MKAESTGAKTASRHGARLREGFAVLAAAAALFLIPAAAGAAGPPAQGSGGKSPVVTLEKIPGKTVPRVILTQKAHERLGIETGQVSNKPVLRRHMVGGLLIPPLEKDQIAAVQPLPVSGSFSFGGFGKGGVASPPPGPAAAKAPPSNPGDVWVLVTLSPGEWEKVDRSHAARLLPLATREKFKKEVWANPSAMEPVEDLKRSMLSLYYVVSGNDHGLKVNTRVRVEMKVTGSGETRKVVPYSAVYYDGKGAAWVYVNSRPLTYEREPIEIQEIVGDLAVLSAGPPLGTAVVTVGAPLLHGAEIFKK